MTRKSSHPRAWHPQGTLRAAQELRGGTRDKDGTVTAHTVPAGRRLDQGQIDKLGLGEADLLKLLAQGAIIEHPGEEGDELTSAAPPAEFDGISRADLHATLAAAGVAVQKGDDVETLLGSAIAHGAAEPFDLDAAAAKIERDVLVDDIKAELDKAEVPYAADAAKPALAKLLAQVRHAAPAA
jgi:hypothetical protein